MEKYKNGQANEVIAMLDKANNELARYVKQTGGVYTKARYKEIAKKLADVSKKLKQKVESGTDIDGLIEYELKKQKKLLDAVAKDIKPVKGGKFNFLYPTVEQIKTSALFKPVDVKTGMTYETYLNGIENGLYNLWDAQIRTGYLTGMTTDQIVRNVMGGISQEAKITHANAMQALRNSIYGNTRTVLQSFATETRNRVFEENEDYFGDGETKYKYEYLATLDARTCLVCGDLDGRLYEKIEDAPSLPQHRGCRCLLIPYFAIEGDKRASKDGYLDDKLTYEDWLEKQDEETKREVLGATRYKLYKQNKADVTTFVDDNGVLGLDKLLDKLGITKNSIELYADIEGSHSLKEDAISVNPHYDPNKKNGYSNNCQRAVVALDARRKGKDVVARPSSSTDRKQKFDRLFNLDGSINENGWIGAYNNPKITKCNTNTQELCKEKVLDKMTSWGNGSRAIVRVVWDKSVKAHTFIAENIKGKIFFVDAMTGEMNVDYYFKMINPKGTCIIRVDNLSFSDKISRSFKEL